jgi:hypothetical protein
MVGSVATAGTAWIMLGNDANGHRILNLSWRWFAGVVGIPSLACFSFTSWYIPESPHFLASQGRIHAVNDVIQFIHDVNGSPRRVKFEFADETSDSSAKPEAKPTAATATSDAPVSVARAVFDMERLKGMARLFHQPYTIGTIVLMLCSCCLSFGSYGLSTWITKLFQSVGLHNPFANAFLFAGANLPGNLVSLYLVDIVGRKQLLSGSFIASATCALLFAFQAEGSATVIVIVSCLFNACTTSAWNAVCSSPTSCQSIAKRGSHGVSIYGWPTIVWRAVGRDFSARSAHDWPRTRQLYEPFRCDRCTVCERLSHGRASARGHVAVGRVVCHGHRGHLGVDHQEP